MDELPPPLRILQLILTGFCLFLAAFGLLVVLMPQQFFCIPEVIMDPVPGDDSEIPVSWSFRYQNTTETITLAVNAAVFNASKNTFRSTMLLGDQKTAGSRYYHAMINDPSQDRIYRDLLEQFRAIRLRQNLSDDEYLELIAAAIQSIPYRDGGNAPPQYPAELLVRKRGDCDDKSILISGLLAREGYFVALLKFGPEQHMAMGIGSDAFFYKSTGYTYLEGMTPAYTGFPTAHLLVSLDSEPLVIPVSSGTKLYRSGDETSSIYTMSVIAEKKAKELTARGDASAEPERNSTEYAALLRERDRFSGIFHYIMAHPYDRPGVYEYLQREMPA